MFWQHLPVRRHTRGLEIVPDELPGYIKVRRHTRGLEN